LKTPQSNYEIEKILAEPDLNDESRKAIRKLNAMEQQALFDLLYYLPDDLLTKVDRASMRFSIETRVPFLDHRLVEFAENIDPKMKFHNGISKYILKEILYQYIPKKFFERPKQGFSIPMNRWLKCELRFLVEEYLNPETVKRAGILNPVETEKMVRDFFAGKNYLYNRIWITIVLQKWMLEHRN
jgi:asparagine synthase (glutamine-hydrolysing)